MAIMMASPARVCVGDVGLLGVSPFGSPGRERRAKFSIVHNQSPVAGWEKGCEGMAEVGEVGRQEPSAA